MAYFLIILREALSNRLEVVVVISGRSETWGAILAAVNA